MIALVRGQVNFRHSVLKLDYLKNELLILCSIFCVEEDKVDVYTKIVVKHLGFIFKRWFSGKEDMNQNALEVSLHT